MHRPYKNDWPIAEMSNDRSKPRMGGSIKGTLPRASVPRELSQMLRRQNPAERGGLDNRAA
jgi:hypothetical protein